MSDPTDWRAWVRKADADDLVIQRLTSAGDQLWDIVCYHAQQRAEKMLKACIVKDGDQPVRTHDLLWLLTDCRRRGIALGDIDEDCRYLTGFGGAARYPGVGLDPTADEARQAIDAAQRISTAALRHLGPAR